jgi:16S rRNA G966 N2-methylase RsmD
MVTANISSSIPEVLNTCMATRDEKLATKTKLATETNSTKINYLMMPIFGNKKAFVPESCEKLVTAWKIGIDISDKLIKLIGTTDCLIIDATANVGGLTIPLSKRFRYVAAYEIEEYYCEILEKNLDSYGINNVTVINRNFNDIIRFCTQPKAIIIDPPWYNEDSSFNQDMKLSGVKIQTIIEYLFLISSPIILVKVPLKYENSELNYDFSYNYKKMKFLVFSRARHERVNHDSRARFAAALPPN